jgi:signal transduction histidine kinase/CheY-like chemotaxis protein
MGYFAAMALLKNLQEVYSSPDKSDVEHLTFDDLAELVELDGSEPQPQPSHEEVSEKPPVELRRKRRGGDRKRSRSTLWSKLARKLRRPAANSAADQIHELNKKNQLLADRLECLEDKSWEVRESEEIHRSISEIFGDLVIHRGGGDGDSAEKLLFSNNIYDLYFNEQFPPPDPASFTGRETADDESGLSHDVELDTLQGRRWFRWTDLPVRDPHTGEVALRSVARDITQQKTSEQEILAALARAEQANAAKSRFLAMVSHEIRTPLNGIIGMAGLMKDSPLAADQKSYIDAISSSGDTLLNLIEDLLDTARIESGQVELALRPCNLRQLVEGVAELLAPVAQEKGLELATFIGPDVPQNLMLDSGRIRQILLNLAGNAVKFTKTGGVGIEVTCPSEIDVEGRTGLHFAVRDSGPGLAESDQQRIFEEFVQTDEGATREHGGAGLGLAISKNLVELMDGQIGVTSRLGRGTTFEFSINTEPPETDGEASVPTPLDQQIAVILHRNPARQALVNSLRTLGARVSTFDSPKAFQINDEPSSAFSAIIAPFAEWPLDDPSSFRPALAPGGRLINISDVTVTAANPSKSQHDIDAWLTRPVRQQTLFRVLSNQIKPGASWRESAEHVPTDMPAMDILLAEDNPINALLAQSLLTKMGHRVVHVENGQHALEQLHNRRFDLLLLDLHMPVMDGLTTLQKMHEELDEADRAAVIVLSADGQEEVRDAALKLGARDFLIKPIDPQGLLETLQPFVPSDNERFD